MINNQKIPWFRLAAEGVVIIGSILIAFTIDAWWEERLEREDEQSYLTSLHQEFSHVRELADTAVTLRSEVLSTNERLIGQIQGDARAPDETLFYWLSLASMPLDLEPPRAVFADLVSSGGTMLIRSDQLRIALALSVPSQIENGGRDGRRRVGGLCGAHPALFGRPNTSRRSIETW